MKHPTIVAAGLWYAAAITFVWGLAEAVVHTNGVILGASFGLTFVYTLVGTNEMEESS